MAAGERTPAAAARRSPRLDLVLEAVPEGVLVVGHDGTVQSVNSRFFEVWGIPPDVVAEGDEAALAAAMARVVEPEGFIRRVRELYGGAAAGHDELVLVDGRVLDRSGTPLISDEGTPFGYVWCFRDVTALRTAERRQAELLRAEREARAVAERSQARLAFLAEVGRSISASADRRGILGRVAGLAVPRLADWCSVYLPDGDRLVRVAMTGPAGRDELRARFIGQGYDVDADAPVARAWRSRRPLLLEDPLVDEPRGVDAAVAGVMRQLDIRSTLIVPVLSAGRPAAVLSFAMEGGTRAFAAEDVELAEQVAGRIAASFDRALLYEREHTLAVSLTQAVLPASLPVAHGLTLAAAYLPAGPSVDVGGDWYDAVAVPGGVALVVGDVAGHGIPAAASMAQLRNAMRAYLHEGRGPGDVLAATARLAHSYAEEDEQASLATAFCAVLDPLTGVLRHSTAGHPPALLCRGSDALFIVDGGGPILGCLPDTGYGEAATQLEPGDRLVLYSDGLVERRDEDLGVSLERLREAACGSHGVSGFAEHLVQVVTAGAERHDDCCVLVAEWAGSGS